MILLLYSHNHPRFINLVSLNQNLITEYDNDKMITRFVYFRNKFARCLIRPLHLYDYSNHIAVVTNKLFIFPFDSFVKCLVYYFVCYHYHTQTQTGTGVKSQ